MAKRVFIIAGEVSGDLIGAQILRELNVKHGSDVEVFGIGGAQMLNAGLKESFVDIAELSVMGFWEVVPKVFKFKRLISDTVRRIIFLNIDEVITIDSPGFSFRVVEKLRKEFGKSGVVYTHYVAPSVWAYKPKRAQKVARLYHNLKCILPFELPYFAKYDINSEYIGYPPLQRLESYLDFIKPDNPQRVVVITLGSRVGEVVRHANILRKAVDIISEILNEEILVVLPTFERLARSCKLNRIFPNAIFVYDEFEKIKWLQRADFAICKSGTNAVEISFFKIPSIVYYKTSVLSYFIIKSMSKIRFVNLINIMSNSEVIPEFLQFDCTAEKLACKTIELLKNPVLQGAQLAKIQSIVDQMRLPSRTDLSS